MKASFKLFMNEAEGTPTRFGMYSRANLAKTRMKKDIHEVMFGNTDRRFKTGNLSLFLSETRRQHRERTAMSSFVAINLGSISRLV